MADDKDPYRPVPGDPELSKELEKLKEVLKDG
jgi:hypothetical protein